MKPLLPEESFAAAGIPGQVGIKTLLYNRPAESLVAAVSRQTGQGPSLQRLYYRRLPDQVYSSVGVRHDLESQQDALCCEGAPFLLFNEWRFREPQPTPEWLRQVMRGRVEPPLHGADWAGIRRFNLVTSEDKRVLDEESINPPPPYAKGWVSELMNVSPDGTGAVCKVGLMAGSKAKYFVYEVSFTEGLQRQVTPLPRIWL